MPDVQESAADREKRERERRIRELLMVTDSPDQSPAAPLITPRPPAPAPAPELPPMRRALQSLAERDLEPVAAEQEAARERGRRSVEEAGRRERARREQYAEDPIAGVLADVGPGLRAFESAATSSVTSGLDDEIAGLLAEGPYHQARAEYGRESRADQAAEPGWALAGTIAGQAPYALLPAGAASRATGALGVAERMHSAGRAAAPIAALQGFGHSDGSLVPTGEDQSIMDYLRGTGRVALDTGVGALGGYALGAGGQLVGEGLGRLGQGVVNEVRPGAGREAVRMADDLHGDAVLRDRINLREEEAAARRLREASGGRALLTNLREMDDVPGGVRQVVDELRDQGGIVAPRGSMFQSPVDAVSQARVRREAVGQRIGDVDRGVQQAFEAGNVEALVDLEPLAQGYAEAAERFAEAGDRAGYARMMDLAEQTAERGSVPMAEARRALDNIDRAVYGAESGVAVPQITRLNDDLAQGLRRAVRTEMDGAIGRVNPTRGATLPAGAQGPREALPTHQADRRRYQALNAFTDGTDDVALRDASRRVITPSDTAAGLAGSVSGGPVTGATMWIANRILRANEHGVAAAFAEREVAQLQRELAQRLSAPVAARVMEQLRPAIARGRHMTALALMQLLRSEPELEQALEGATPSEDEAADDARAERLGATQEQPIDEDADEERARRLGL